MASSLADTSGTYGQTIVDVTSVIEHAVRRCGVSAAFITAEQQQSARENLFFILSNLATKGLSLWCIQRLTFDLIAGRSMYTLPVGTIDLLELLLRRATRTAATTTGAGAATLTATEALSVSSVVVTPAVAGTYDLVLEYSADGVTWVLAGEATVQYTDIPLGVDVSRTSSVLYWRVRDTLDPTRVLSAAVFLSDLYDVPMSKISRDSYATYPNKQQQSEWPLQYWYDKQFYQPQVNLWPVPSVDVAVQAFIQRQVQDPGAFTNAIQVPQRWLDAIISLLAPRVCLELPKELVPPDRYDKLVLIADQTQRDAEDSETDGAPVMVAPNISYYSR